jgi:hypothetical protein
MAESVSLGIDSQFDTPGWLHFPPPEYEHEAPMFAVVQKAMMQLIVRIPRLLKLVREIRRNPTDFTVNNEASDLAHRLYCTNLSGPMATLISQSAERVPTEDSELAKYYPQSLQFSTMCMMEALIRYHFCRIIVIGLCRQLKIYGLFPITNKATTLEDEEVESAGMIVMSMQHAHRHGHAIPMGSLLTMVPLQIACGSWYRRGQLLMARADMDVGNEEVAKARFMTEWCRVRCNDILERWSGQPMSSDMVKAQVEVLEGGALENWKARKGLPAVKREEGAIIMFFVISKSVTLMRTSVTTCLM